MIQAIIEVFSAEHFLLILPIKIRSIFRPIMNLKRASQM